MKKESLIPRKILFGNPDKVSVTLSPDGKRIAYLAPHNGVLNLYVADRDDITNSRVVTNDKLRGIRRYFWAYDNKHILYLQDDKGDENWHLYKIDLSTLQAQDVTPFKQTLAQVAALSQKKPETLIVGLNNRDPKYFDLYELDIASGKLTLLHKNTQELADFLLDDDYKIRFVSKTDQNGGRTIFEVKDKFELDSFMHVDYEDDLNTRLAGLDSTGNLLYLIDSRSRNTSALFVYDLKRRSSNMLFESSQADVVQVLMHPKTQTAQAASIEYLRDTWHVLDESIKKDMNLLSSAHPTADMQVTSRDEADKYWIVAYIFDAAPVSYYLYDRDKSDLKFLFTKNKALKQYQLAQMHPVIIKARDGLDLISYLTLPETAEYSKKDKQDSAQQSFKLKRPVPLILNVHGGPRVRDSWGLDNEAQWLANRGYAVLNVNYRGSTGFGKEFVNKSNGEWGGKMHEDILDAAQWAIDQGITTQDKICIFGGSYGGYEALVGLALTPNIFACGVDIVGPSNLYTLLKSIPPYWAPYYWSLVKNIGGNPETDEGLEFLKLRSPLTFAERITKPLLIAQGANDPRVKRAEADQIVSSMAKHNIPVIYLLYPDEGHGFARPENRMSFYAVTEQFLAKILGGKVEPIGDEFKDSSVEILNGKELLQLPS